MRTQQHTSNALTRSDIHTYKKDKNVNSESKALSFLTNKGLPITNKNCPADLRGKPVSVS